MTPRAERTARMPRADNLLAVHADVRALVDAQAGVATRTQLARCGVGHRQTSANLAARRWRSFGRHVIVLTNAPLTPAQRAWVAVLLLEKPCALAGPSAAADAGLTGFEPDRVHVVVQHATHVATPSWMKVHESRRFRPTDIVAGAGIPRTRTERSLVDTATWSRSPRRACAILCAGVQQRLVRAERLEGEIAAAGRIRHVRIMREICGDIAGGGHTLAEIELAPLARLAGLGAPRRQALRRDAAGRVRYLDAEFDLPDGTQLAVEIDGAMHLKPLRWWDDMDRQNEVVIGGRPMLRFASVTVRLNERRVVDQLSRMRIAHL